MEDMHVDPSTMYNNPVHVYYCKMSSIIHDLLQYRKTALRSMIIYAILGK